MNACAAPAKRPPVSSSRFSTAALALAALLLFALPGLGQPVVAFTTLGPGGTFDPAFLIVNSADYLASPLTPSVTGRLATVTIPIFKSGTPTANLIVSLRAPGPNPNGAILEQWSIAPSDVPTTASLATLASVAQPMLTNGTTYWLRLESQTPFTSAGSFYGWNSNSIGAMGSMFSTNGVSWGGVLNPSFALEVAVETGAPPDSRSFSNDGAFQIRYAANLAIGDSVINLTNDGASTTSGGFGLDAAANNFQQYGQLCANIYAYSPDEQLVSCCSCNITPNGLNSLSVKNDLASNTLTPIIPSALVIKIVATEGGSKCTASSAASIVDAIRTPTVRRAGLLAWGTTIHAAPVTPGTPAGTYSVTETAFSNAQPNIDEFARMSQLCAFIRGNGSGYGICKSCKIGGLGGSIK